MVISWRMYQNYADTRMLEEHFESARRWIDFIHGRNPDLLWSNDRGDGDHGDWLNGDTMGIEGYPRGVGSVPKDVFGTAFFAHSTEILSKMAGVLGRKDDAANYGRLFEGIKAAFTRAYVDADGRIKGDTQAGYALALHFRLIDESLRQKALEHLLEAIQKYQGHVSAGFHASNRMMIELSRSGRHDEACRLMNLRTLPSWGYMVEMGATTIWERWDGYVEGQRTSPARVELLKPVWQQWDGYGEGAGPWGGFQHPDMNSFNHMAHGSVGEWMWRELAGINPDENEPGYKHVLIRPRPDREVTWVKACYDSIRGPVVSEWNVEDGSFHLDVEIPANTTATIFVPAQNADAVTEGSVPAATAEAVTFVRMEDRAAVFHVGSGRYRFRARRTGDSGR